jgi:murein DD-endopeptidase MepM/ murein hydrolase activator NlpD
MRIVVAIACVILFGAVAVAASGSREVGAGPTPRPFHTALPAVATVAPDVGERLARADARLARRFIVPIEGAEIPVDAELLPGALRDYRSGIHEGVDFPAPEGTPVRAAASGRVVRVDSTYAEWSEDELDAALAEALTLGYTPAATLDRIRGRQVWIDHGAEMTTRYAHLSAVEPLIVGQTIEAGVTIGAVGSSGYPQGGPHLHLEVRLGDAFYADGLEGDALARAVARLFR